MCGFAGFFDLNINLKYNESRNTAVVRRMQRRLFEGTGMNSSVLVTEHCAVSYTEPKQDKRISVYSNGKIHVVLMTAESANDDVRKNTINAESVFYLYTDSKQSFACDIDRGCLGVIIDETCKVLVLFNNGSCRTSLYYMLLEGRIVFATELKGLLEYPGSQAILSLNGIRSLFEIGVPPKHTTVFDGMFSLPPFYCALYAAEKFLIQKHPSPISDIKRCYERIIEDIGSDVKMSFRELSEDRIISFLLEAAILRDCPVYSTQADIRLLSMYRSHEKFTEKELIRRFALRQKSRAPYTLLRPNVFRKFGSVNERIKDNTFLTEESTESNLGPVFGELLQAKLRAIMRDKSQPIHRVISSDTVYKCLSAPEQYERSLFFILQLSLWINHYRVFVKV